MTGNIQAVEHDRERFLDLLLLADPSLEMIHRYLAQGHLFVLFEDGEAYGVVHLLPLSNDIIEVKNIAVKEEVQERGYGKKLLHYALAFCQQKDYKKVVVGTGNSGINGFAFYQKAGFRFVSVIRDFFTDNYPKPIFEHGIQCRDMVMLEVDFSQN